MSRKKKNEGPILVVAAVIRQGEHFLICKRPIHKSHGGLWEFPGGKMNPDESIEAALRREIIEELGVDVISTGAVLFVGQEPESEFEIHFVEVIISGEPRPLEHERFEWTLPNQFKIYSMAPMDLKFAEQLSNEYNRRKETLYSSQDSNP